MPSTKVPPGRKTSLILDPGYGVAVAQIIVDDDAGEWYIGSKWRVDLGRFFPSNNYKSLQTKIRGIICSLLLAITRAAPNSSFRLVGLLKFDLTHRLSTVRERRHHYRSEDGFVSLQIFEEYTVNLGPCEAKSVGVAVRGGRIGGCDRCGDGVAVGEGLRSKRVRE
ncbi:hypothetical protein L1887_24879 [Cichorium endivia]|nr:hypothetical protein L1887_24879 [Cichorium endivia]